MIQSSLIIYYVAKFFLISRFRESAAGINRVSYFLAVNLAYIPVLLITPVIYLSIYYSIAAFLGMCEFVRLWVGGCKYRIRRKYGGSYGVGELDSGQVSCFVIGVGEGSFVRMLVRILGMEGGRGGN